MISVQEQFSGFRGVLFSFNYIYAVPRMCVPAQTSTSLKNPEPFSDKSESSQSVKMRISIWRQFVFQSLTIEAS